jgi:uncharacterized membrane protein
MLKQEPSSSKTSLEDIEHILLKLNDKLDWQNNRIEDLEKKLESGGISKREAIFSDDIKKGASEEILPPPPPPLYDETPDTSSKDWDQKAEAVPANVFLGEENVDLSDSDEDVSASKEKLNLEERIGGNLFAKVGLAAVVLGVSFFLKYAFDQNWIGEAERVIIGLIIGLIFFGVGEKTIRKYSGYGQLMTAGGLVVWYLSIYASYNFYQLIPQTAAFIGMMLVTGVGILVSLRYDALSLILAAILGGFLTPFLIENGKDQQFALFSYTMILDLAVLAVSMRKKWRALNLLGFFGTVIIFLSWYEEYYSRNDFFTTMFFLSLFFLIYSISALIYNLVKNEKSTGFEQGLTLLIVIFYFITGYGMLEARHPQLLGFFALTLSIYYLLLAYLTREITPEDKTMNSFLALLSLAGVIVGISLQFDGSVVTIGWAAVAMVLLWWSLYGRKKLFHFIGIALYSVVLFRLFFENFTGKVDGSSIFLNQRFLTFLVVIAISYVLAYVFYQRGFVEQTEESDGAISVNNDWQKSLVIFLIVANLLSIFSVSQELVTYYNYQVTVIKKAQFEANKPSSVYRNDSTPERLSSSEYAKKIKQLNNKRDISVSLYWIFYAICATAIGFVKKSRAVRIGGMLLLILSILKLFFIDLWNYSSLYRIISTICLGLVLLAISFAYQKYKEKIREVL